MELHRDAVRQAGGDLGRWPRMIACSFVTQLVQDDVVDEIVTALRSNVPHVAGDDARALATHR